MAIEMRYRFEVRLAIAGEGFTGDLQVNVNGTYAQRMNLNQAITSCLAFVRRYQSIGIDVEGRVFGRPSGTSDATAPAYTLAAGEADEETYALLDAPGKGLLQRIAAANKEAAGTASFDPDVNPDIAAVVA